MAHFAELDDNNIVKRVIVIDNSILMNPTTGKEEELRGVFFCENAFGGKWVQTSYNHKMRFRYAGIGYTYNKDLDAFIPPKPFTSWILNNETANWEAPVSPPSILTIEQMESGLTYIWDEENLRWELVDRSN